MKTFKILKPKGTFYSDYDEKNNSLYAVFEHDNRTTCKKVCELITPLNWRTDININETKTHYILKLKNCI